MFRYLMRRPGLVAEAVVYRRFLDAVWLQGAGFVINLGHAANPGCG